MHDTNNEIMYVHVHPKACYCDVQKTIEFEFEKLLPWKYGHGMEITLSEGHEQQFLS